MCYQPQSSAFSSLWGVGQKIAVIGGKCIKFKISLFEARKHKLGLDLREKGEGVWGLGLGRGEELVFGIVCSKEGVS